MTNRPSMQVQEVSEKNDPQPYEPPQIESVLTADELAREVQYAGSLSTDALS